MADGALLHGETEASYAVAAGAGVLRRHGSSGEFDDVTHALPESIRPLLR